MKKLQQIIKKDITESFSCKNWFTNSQWYSSDLEVMNNINYNFRNAT